MHILVTGGLGYIGSHAAAALMQANHQVTILDNLSNSSLDVLPRLSRVAGRSPVFHQLDVRDAAGVDALLASSAFDGVMHFAGLKAVGESVAQPLQYYDNNVHGSVVLFDAMQRHGVFRLVFSSSATVYGHTQQLPISESAPVGPTNPYGRTKLMVEDVLKDVAQAEPRWSIAVLRYFNPVGAHPSALLGEEPKGIPNNLMPYVAQVALGQRESVSVFGNDYSTPDGTGVRDYIHVCDLVDGHLAALKHLESHRGWVCFNLGTGHGYSVLELIAAYAKASGRTISHRMAPRRPGDVAACFADASSARRVLGWEAKRDLAAMCEDSWRHVLSPRGTL